MHITGSPVAYPTATFKPRLDVVELLGVEFTNVFYDITPKESFAELYVNMEHGVVGFKDGANDLYIFDRIEEEMWNPSLQGKWLGGGLVVDRTKVADR